MEAANLIHMANRIGEFFAAFPDRAEALDGVATHLAKFWDPRMRRQIFAELDAGRAEDLSPLVRESLVRNRAKLTPEASPARSPQ